jgi:hypothetical protein
MVLVVYCAKTGEEPSEGRNIDTMSIMAGRVQLPRGSVTDPTIQDGVTALEWPNPQIRDLQVALRREPTWKE